MDEVNSENSEWKTPNSSEFGSLEMNNVKQNEFDETKENIDLDFGANKRNNGHGDGNDSGVDTGATNPVQLQRALSSNSAGYASSSGGLDAQFASCNSSLLSVCSDDGKTTVLSYKRNIDCTSENGSESSSLSSDKQQRCIQVTPNNCLVLQLQLSSEANQSKPSRSSDRSLSIGKNRVRAASINRVKNHSYGAPILATTERARSRDKQITTNSQSSPTKRVKPGSILLISSKDGTPVQEKGSTLRRAASMSRRTPSCTPTTEDGRWPFNQFRSTTKVRNLNESLVIKTKVGHIVLESKKVKSEEDLSEWQSNRNSSTTRDRMSSSTIVRKLSTRESSNKGVPSFPPRYQKPSSKTLIYHEAGIQTALTSNDIENAFGGHRSKEVQIEAIIKVHRESQADMRDKEIEQLEEKLRSMDADNKRLRQNLFERSQMLTSIESQLSREREEKAAMKKEMQSNTCKTSTDSLLMLESQIQLSGHALEEKQAEINQLKIEMNRSIQVQQNLLEEKKCFEKESNELHDFLQDEKTAIFEALKDAESEIEGYEEKLKQKELKVERLEDECRHLVRISEQRRQEFLGLKTQYTALESKIKKLVVQHSQVSGATHALSDLGSRLNDLVDQLVGSYNISEQEMEDVLIQNEPYSEESTPENESNPIIIKSLPSPHRHHSFITAVVGLANGTEMLDSETEPCLMMENVLEDVSLPDSHTQNLVSSTVLPSIYSLGDNHDDSLQLLCEAITKRQKIEEQATLHMNVSMHTHSEKDISDMEKIINSSSCEQVLLDKVINVDKLVTKLLKVLSIIQINNEKFIQHLMNEKNTLQSSKEETKGGNSILEINKLNEDISSLSILCLSDINHLNTDEKSKNGHCKSEETPITPDNETSIKKDVDNTNLNGFGLNLNTRRCAVENKSQNDTIVKAIETLNGIHSIVKQCPALIDLQRDLEQMLPSDCNANSQFE